MIVEGKQIWQPDGIAVKLRGFSESDIDDIKNTFELVSPKYKEGVLREHPLFIDR
jgi:hypothetical protein